MAVIDDINRDYPYQVTISFELGDGLPVVATSSMDAYQSGVGIATTYDGPIPALLAYEKV